MSEDFPDLVQDEAVNVARGLIEGQPPQLAQVENFFGQLKRSLDGTYHAVSPYYLHLYVSEFAYRYNHRREAIFPLLVAKAATPIE